MRVNCQTSDSYIHTVKMSRAVCACMLKRLTSIMGPPTECELLIPYQSYERQITKYLGSQNLTEDMLSTTYVSKVEIIYYSLSITVVCFHLL